MFRYDIQKAKIQDFDTIWDIILFAKETRKQEGSDQWQDGYPSKETIEQDILNGYGYVLTLPTNSEILGYMAIIMDIKEPPYAFLDGYWLNEQPYATVHRMAVSKNAKGKGVGKMLLTIAELLVKEKGIHNMRIDTNFDNLPMLRILDKLGYTYCGIIYQRNSQRKAFHKVLGDIVYWNT